MRYTGANAPAVLAWMYPGAGLSAWAGVSTPGQNCDVNPGDWIVRDAGGNFTAWDPDRFEEVFAPRPQRPQSRLWSTLGARAVARKKRRRADKKPTPNFH